MLEQDLKKRLSELSRRLEAARGAGGANKEKQAERKGSALGQAYRIGLELVAAVVAGGAIGWALDRWLGTAPWLMILFFMLGVAAGFVNVYKAAGKSDSGASSGQK